MKICCQVSTPDVYERVGVTSFQGELSQVFPLLSSWGYQGVELTVRDPSAVDCSRIKELSETHHLPIAMICTGELYGQDRLSFADSDSSIRQEALRRFKGAVDLAHRFSVDVNLGRVRGGYVPEEEPSIRVKRIEEGLREVVAYAAEKDVTILLEPVNTLALNYINTTEEGLQLVNRINSPHFQLMVDTAHIHIEDRNPAEAFKKGKDHIRYVHLADSNRKYPGGGVFDFASFIALLKEIGYDGWLGVEVFPMPDQVTAFRTALETVSPMIS